MGVSPSTVSRITGLETHYKNFNTGNTAMLPQQLAIVGQGNDDAVYSLDKYEIEGSAEVVAQKYGYGSPLHLAALQLFPKVGAMATFPVYILPVVKGTQWTKAQGEILITGTATKAGGGTVSVGGVDAEFSVAKGTSSSETMAAIVATINAVLEMPAVAIVTPAAESVPEHISLTAKWSGALGNSITIVMDADLPGLTVAITAFAGGAGTPDVTGALEKVGQKWISFILSTFDYKTGSALDTYQTWGEGRWSVLQKMPCIVAHGCTDNYTTRTAITDERKNDYINFLITSVGSPELPFVVAAKALLSDIVTTADSNPPQNYKGQLTGLKAGSDDAQETPQIRNQSILKGASNNIKSGNIAELNDIVTFYHPDSEGKYPGRRYVVDAVKLMNIVYNCRLITESDQVKGAPLVPDAQVTTNPKAIKPKTIKGWLANLAHSLALNAIISDEDFTKETLQVGINSENPKRVDYVFPCKLSGNVEVISGDIYFGFYVG